MKRRFLVLVVSLALFGLAFGCIPVDSENYMLSYQHTADSDILIVETALPASPSGDVTVVASAVPVSGGDELTTKCAVVDNKKRGRCEIFFPKGELPKDGTYEIEIQGSVNGSELVTTPSLDVSAAKFFPIRLEKIVEQDEDYRYTFVLSGSVAESVDNATLKLEYGFDIIDDEDIEGARQIVEPLADCNPLVGTEFSCEFSFDNRHPITVPFRWVRVVDGEGNVITPFLSMKGCVQTEDIAKAPGANVCLPYVEDDSDDSNLNLNPVPFDPEFNKIPQPQFTFDPCATNPDAEGCTESDDSDGDNGNDVGDDDGEGDDFVDSDGDGVADENDKCPDEDEVYDLSTIGPADGILDGCPNSSAIPVLPGSDSDVDIDTGYASIGADTGGACSLSGGGATNPATFLLLGLALMPMAIRRKKK